MFEKAIWSEEVIKKSTKLVINQLESMEIEWTKKQKAQWQVKIEESLKKKSRSVEYQDVILQKCKQHGGLIVTTKDLNDLLNSTNEKDIKTYLCQEISFQKLMHPIDAKDRSHLYKMNYLTVEQMVQNLTILLNITENSDQENQSYEPLPTEEEIYQLVSNSKPSQENKED